MIKKCDRESEHRRTYTLTDANWFYNLSHAICYSYGTDNKLGNDVANVEVNKSGCIYELIVMGQGRLSRINESLIIHLSSLC